MFLALFGDRSARWPQTMNTGIMFADLSGIHSESLVESCQPEKCSWSYRGVHLSRRRVESTEKMFMDLSRRSPPPSPNCAQPEKMFPDLSGDRSARWPQTMNTGMMFA